jgi:predicted nucleic acid-binding protein
MKKLKVYLDTSVLNFYYAKDAPDKMVITKVFFREVRNKNIVVFVSDTVIREINEASEVKRTKLMFLVKELELKVLPVTSDAEKLADIYVSKNIIPLRFRDDAVHIALAVLNRIELIVSWNLEHMVKIRTVSEVNKINEQLDYAKIDIRTPEEVLP